MSPDRPPPGSPGRGSQSYLKMKPKKLSCFRDLPVRWKRGAGARSADRDNRRADREVKKVGRWKPTRKYSTLRACGCGCTSPTRLGHIPSSKAFWEMVFGKINATRKKYFIIIWQIASLKIHSIRQLSILKRLLLNTLCLVSWVWVKSVLVTVLYVDSTPGLLYATLKRQ